MLRVVNYAENRIVAPAKTHFVQNENLICEECEGYTF